MDEERYINWAKNQLGEEVEVIKEEYGDQSDVFKLRAPGGNYYLKIGNGLENEYERLNWLQGKLSVPKVFGFIKIDERDSLLMSAIEGKNLATLAKEWNPEKIAEKLASALHHFHAVDAKHVPFGMYEAGKVLVHGDACLPNFIFQGDNFSGYIDLGDSRLANIEVDFAAAIWSLQFNLGSGYGPIFLKAYGVKDVNDEMVKKLRLKYEDMQEEWGL